MKIGNKTYTNGIFFFKYLTLFSKFCLILVQSLSRVKISISWTLKLSLESNMSYSVHGFLKSGKIPNLKLVHRENCDL